MSAPRTCSASVSPAACRAHVTSLGSRRDAARGKARGGGACGRRGAGPAPALGAQCRATRAEAPALPPPPPLPPSTRPAGCGAGRNPGGARPPGQAGGRPHVGGGTAGEEERRGAPLAARAAPVIAAAVAGSGAPCAQPRPHCAVPLTWQPQPACPDPRPPPPPPTRRSHCSPPQAAELREALDAAHKVGPRAPTRPRAGAAARRCTSGSDH